MTQNKNISSSKNIDTKEKKEKNTPTKVIILNDVEKLIDMVKW